MRAIEHRRHGDWPETGAVDSVTLDYDSRHRRRIVLMTDGQAQLLLDLPKAVAMAHGDGLLLEDGRWLRVRAAPEALVEIRAEDATQLARIAWHIGNRHFPAQILDGAIRIRPDHVMEAMILGQGGALTRLEAPFQPEGGAYGGAQPRGPANAHSHAHDDRNHDGHGHAHHTGHGRYDHSHDY
jgi:urease accessory protein